MTMLQVHRSIDSRSPVVQTAGRALLSIVVLSVATTAPAMDFMAGADISALHLLQENGAVYSDNGVPGDPVEIMADHGVNWARLRLFLDADGQYLAVQDLEYTLQQALEIQASAPDMQFLLDFHYSDTWADPGKQFKPAEWAGQSGVQLQDTLRDYTRDTIIAFKDAGVMPDMVQIGNEISNGMIWPDGRLWQGNESQEFDNLAALVSMGINGARLGANDTSGSPAAAEPLMMIHTDKGGNPGASDYWLDRLLPRLQTNGTDPDVIGVSYYPLWHYGSGAGNLDALRSNLQHIADPIDGHGKPVVIVEAGFASSGDEDTGWFEWPSESPENQQEYLEDMVTAVRDVDNGMGWGVFWWYAEAIPTPGLPGEIWMDGRLGLFDADGDLLPAIDAFTGMDLAGDYDDNGVGGVGDYIVWRDSLGQSITLQNVHPDALTHSLVDQEDYDFFKANFGATTGSSQAAFAAVPEPGSLGLVALACLWFSVTARRRSGT